MSGLAAWSLCLLAAAAGAAGFWLGRALRPPGRPEARNPDTRDRAIDAASAAAFVWPADDAPGAASAAPVLEAGPRARAALMAKLDLPPDADAARCLAVLEARHPPLVRCLEALRRDGAPFRLLLPGMEARGRAAGPHAVMWIAANDRVSDLSGAEAWSLPLWRTDRQGRLLWANAAYLRAVEARSLEDARARDLSLDPRAVEDARHAADGQALADTRMIVVDGRRRALRLHLFPAPGGAAGIALDVSAEAEELEALTRGARAHLETLDHLTDAVAVFDQSRRLATRNRAFANLWGLEEAWLDERPSHGEWLDRLRQSARIRAQRDFSAFKTRELGFYQEAGQIPDETWTLPDGRILRVARQRQPEGGLLILFEDISDKMGLQARYKTLIEVQRATLDKLNEGVAVFTADGGLSLANAAFAAMFGLEPAFLEARPDFALLSARAEAALPEPDFWSDLKARVTDPSPAARREAKGESSTTTGLRLTWLTKPLPDGATLVAFADVSAARAVEVALRDKAAAFEDADRLKTEFVRNVSYQLRTPLTTISGYAQLLSSGMAGPLAGAQPEYLAAVSAAADQLGKLIENILDLAMIDAGKMSLDLGDVDLAQALDDTAAMVRAAVSEAQVEVEVTCPPDIGIIRGDNARIRQMLFNLASNALRLCRPGDRIGLSARRIGDSVRLQVSDTGPGVDPSRQAAVFDGFTDADRRAGLGLALVKRFAELHGGWVSMASPEGGGVTISCHLPARAATDHAAPELDLGVEG